MVDALCNFPGTCCRFCVFLALISFECYGFTAVGTGVANRPRGDRHATRRLSLAPIANFDSDMTFLSGSHNRRGCIDQNGCFKDNDETYVLGIAEEDDYPDVSRLLVEAFDSDAIALSGDLSNFERAFLQPAATILNGYSGLVAYAEVLSGLRSRTQHRRTAVDISPPSLDKKSRQEQLLEAERTSLVLALGKRVPGSDWRIDTIATVELRLQPCDAKIPFSYPWLDEVERKLAQKIGLSGSDKTRDLQPYLSNLCVDKKFRGKSIGKSLVRCVEDIARNVWGYETMYLHVDLKNEAAYNLYLKEGYRDVGVRWRPFWAGQASAIGYFVKRFRGEGVGKEKALSLQQTKTE